jgi:hypothetical protein
MADNLAATDNATPAPSISTTIENVQTYRDYKGKMNTFTSKLDEILYLCDMVDIDKIDQFLINFLETYDFYKKKEEEEGGYSDLRGDDKALRQNIIEDTEYTNMIDYISENYEKIKALFEKLNTDHYPSIKTLLTNDNNAIKDDLKNQKGNIIEKIEKIIRLLEIRTNTNSIAPLPFEKLKFYNVAFINKNDIICAIDGYYVFKAIYKKLHVLNNEDKELNNKFEEVFKYEFYIIYTELHNKFKEPLINDKSKIQKVIDDINEIKRRLS